MFLECFAGEGTVTAGCMLHNVPCIRPWDVKNGNQFDVLGPTAPVVTALIDAGVIAAMHFGVSCKTNTFARSMAVRSFDRPWGVCNLSEKGLAELDIANALYVWTMAQCAALWYKEGFFSLENPFPGWAWILPPVVRVWCLPGVILSTWHQRNTGSPCDKLTGLLHNLPSGHTVSRIKVSNPLPKVELRGLTTWKNEVVWRTHLSQAYAPAFGIWYGGVVQDAIELKVSAENNKLPVPMALDHHDEWRQWNMGADENWQANELWCQENNPEDQCVPNGGGVLAGLNPLQHIDAAAQVKHPLDVPYGENMPEDLQYALYEEVWCDPEDLHKWRLQQLDKMLYMVVQLRHEYDEWINEAPCEIRPIVAMIHGPLIEWCLKQTPFKASDREHFLRGAQFGFPFVGALPPIEYETCIQPKLESTLCVSELIQNRQLLNSQVVKHCQDSEWGHDVMQQTTKDSETGWMMPPRLLQAEDLLHFNVAARLPVREYRAHINAGAGGYRTRVVDHFSLGLQNQATSCTRKLEAAGLDMMNAMICYLMDHNANPVCWKRDVQSAYRRVPIAPQHWMFSAVVFSFQAQLFLSQHWTMPFGSVSACWGFHQCANVIQAVLRWFLAVPCARYVDDFYGVQQHASEHPIGYFVSSVMTLFGFPADEDKSCDLAQSMLLLGARISMAWAKRGFYLAIDEDKRQRYIQLMQRILQDCRLDPGGAQRLVGKLSFSVCVTTLKTGRAFLRSLHAQANAPLRSHKVGPWLASCLRWFIEYLYIQPMLLKTVDDIHRQTIRTWTDAATEPPCIAAIIHVPNRGYSWCRMWPDEQLLQQLLPRHTQVAALELLAVVMAQHTFAEDLKECNWLAFIDSEVVRQSLCNGTMRGGGQDCNVAIGRFWLELCRNRTAFWSFRVESKANPADSPTRNDLSVVAALCAREDEVPATLPSWLLDLWQPLDLSADDPRPVD